jgi:S1-C subfamily serine protease
MPTAPHLAPGPALQRRALLALAAALMAAPARAGLPDTVARLRRSVVPVGTYSATDNPRFSFRGTGFAVGDGSLVATNAHVVPELAEVEQIARLAVLAGAGPGEGQGAGGTVRMARLLVADRTHDLALLKIEGEALPALPLAGAAAREGQAIALMGFPIGGTFGFAPVTHRGIVASLTRLALPAASAQQLDTRAIARLREGNIDVLQLDATAYPGNSGGPVFDPDSGEVLGVLNMVLVRGSRESALSQPTGISYAIPARHLAQLLQGR